MFFPKSYLGGHPLWPLFLLWLAVIAVATLANRVPAELPATPQFIPFHSHRAVLNGENKEIFRSNLMNVVLFYPAGLLACELLPKDWGRSKKVILTVVLFALISAGIEVYYHGGSANHGCEAIVRSTNKLLGPGLTLWTTNIASDQAYALDSALSLSSDWYSPVQKPSLKWFASAVHHKLTNTGYLHVKYSHNAFFSQVKPGDICLSIGGDNYCYTGQDILGYCNRIIHQKGANTVLWGCSVEPELLNRADIAKDIARYDLIVARETISYEALKQVNPNTMLAPDPAFFLDSLELPLPDGFTYGNTVGINVSPLIMKSESRDGITFENYRRLISYILTETDMSIALIPHVVEPGNDDRETLQSLYDGLSDNGRIVLIEDHDARQLKGSIARYRFFVGARTHATIAAYSSCVPTLVVGYSVKAKGIARDLFGTESNYVLPVQTIEDSSTLVQAFRWIVEHEQEICAHLQRTLPSYESGMALAVSAVRSLCKK